MTPSVAAEDAEDAELYERVAPELIRFASALVGRVDAPDVLSAAVVKVLAKPGWPGVVNRRAYLYRSVYNEARTWLRRAGQRPILEARAARAAAVDRWELPLPATRRAGGRIPRRRRKGLHRRHRHCPVPVFCFRGGRHPL